MANIDYAVNAQDFAVDLTNPDEEYSQELPSNAKAIEFRSRNGADVRHSFTQGLVATPTGAYQTLKANAEYKKDRLNLNKHTVYFASGTGGDVVELRVWI
jgi:hypothetical protein